MFSNSAIRRPASTTEYPCFRSARLAARPIPLPAPVTSAILFVITQKIIARLLPYERVPRHQPPLDIGQVRRYLTFMKTILSSKGQIVLPAEFRQLDRVEQGQEFDVERVDTGNYRLVRRTAPRNQGVVEWLLACPQKDFFVPIDSESTDSL